MDTTRQTIRRMIRGFKEAEEPQTITLGELYADQFVDEHEVIWSYIGRKDFDHPLPIYHIDPKTLRILGKEMLVSKSFEQFATAEQQDLVDRYAGEMAGGVRIPDHVIVVKDRREVLDGNHRTIAAIQAGVEIPAVDIMDLPE